jgi:MFS family permease
VPATPDPIAASPRARAGRWLVRWGPVLPLLVAEATIWVGFGALLPILPLWITEHGTDLPTLGLVIAAWPAARLVGEPVFGRLADSGPRKAMMVTGLVLASLFAILPLYLTGPLAFLALRALAGMAAAIYDPAARGYLMDAVPAERHGEMFGMYAAAQMGGLMLGPVVGGVTAGLAGEPAVVFWVAGAALLVSAVVVAARVPELGRRAPVRVAAPGEDGLDLAGRPVRLLNVLLVAALVMNVGAYFTSGTYEVVWSLYLTSLGADLTAIGLTFASFGLPILVLSPFTGRLIDRTGGYRPLVGGMIVVAGCGAIYPLVPEVWWVVLLGLVEGTGLAFAGPALFALVARAAPPGRSSTAQGVFGAAGTVGTIVASLGAGVLATVDLRLPFFATAFIALGGLLVGLAVGHGRIARAMAPVPAEPPAPGAAADAAATAGTAAAT